MGKSTNRQKALYNIFRRRRPQNRKNETNPVEKIRWFYFYYLAERQAQLQYFLKYLQYAPLHRFHSQNWKIGQLPSLNIPVTRKLTSNLGYTVDRKSTHTNRTKKIKYSRTTSNNRNRCPKNRNNKDKADFKKWGHTHRSKQ